MKHYPNIRQLQYFVALYETQSFSKASDQCGVTQSTLSAGIKALEDMLQQTLVERTSRQVSFTPLGKTLVEEARGLFDKLDDFMEQAEAGYNPLHGRVQWGIIPTIAPFFVPKLLGFLKASYPGMQAEIKEDLTDHLLAQLVDGAIDIALIALPYKLDGLERFAILEEAFQLADKNKGGELKAADLKDQKLLLLDDGHCMTDHALEACKLDSTQRDDKFRAASLHTLVSMVDKGYGTTLLPEMAIEAGITKGLSITLHPIKNPKPTRTIALVWKPSLVRNSFYKKLAADMKGWLGRD